MRINNAKLTRLIFALACAVLAAPTLAVTIETVPIGNPGNAPDYRYSVTGLGAVATLFHMGKYEVTTGQYTEFLNAVADADPNNLYSTQMANIGGTALGCNIQRTGASGNFAYTVAVDWADRPVNWISFWDAARFANWLHNGQPNGSQGPGTTEDGAYANVGNQTLFARQPGAKYFIPTENEWYKAAYHDKSAGIAANYFDFPYASDVLPGVDPAETTNPGTNANYKKDNVYVIGSPYYRTIVGEFELSDSPYGTFDQGGNAVEWVETAFGTFRGLRGGIFDDTYLYDLHAREGNSANVPTNAFNGFGFRVASTIPEPSALTLCVGALLAVWRRRTPSRP